MGVEKPLNGSIRGVSTFAPTSPKQLLQAPFVNGEIKSTARLGVSIDVDMFLAGVRAANASSFLGAQATLALKTDTEMSYGVKDLNSPWEFTPAIYCLAGSKRAGGTAAMVHTVEPQIVAALSENGVVLENAAVWMRDTELLHAMRDTKALRGATLPEDVWRELPTKLEDAVAYLDTSDNALVYVIDEGLGLGKVVVRVNYNEKGRFDGVRARIKSNFVVTGGLIEPINLTGNNYKRLTR